MLTKYYIDTSPHANGRIIGTLRLYNETQLAPGDVIKIIDCSPLPDDQKVIYSPSGKYADCPSCETRFTLESSPAHGWKCRNCEYILEKDKYVIRIISSRR